MKTTETLMHSCAAEFLVGDVVVLKTLEPLCVTDLMTLKSFDGGFWLTDHHIGRLHADVIRTATVAELQAKRRLGVSHE